MSFEPDIQKVAKLVAKTLDKDRFAITGATITLAPGWLVEVDALKEEYRLVHTGTGLILDQIQGANLTNFRRAVWYKRQEIFATKRSTKKTQGKKSVRRNK